jgi:hypothetical protein
MAALQSSNHLPAIDSASGISNHVENLLAWCLLENMPESKQSVSTKVLLSIHTKV